MTDGRSITEGSQAKLSEQRYRGCAHHVVIEPVFFRIRGETEIINEVPKSKVASSR